MCASKVLGKRYRDAAKFNEAVIYHRQALGLAEQLCDTVEIIQICNQIGTNFRRMGIMDEASTYHYKALALCEQYHDKSSYEALKNRVVSLNGIGNVQLSMENPGPGDQLCQYRRNLRKAGYDRLGLDLLSSFHAA